MRFEIGERNRERFESAKLARPDLTVDKWINMLFEAATHSRMPEPQASLSRSSGRPPGVRGRAVTGATIKPMLARYLLSQPTLSADSKDAVRHLEREVADHLTAADRSLTAARVPRWQHAIYSQVAYLRSKGLLEQSSASDPNVWQLSAAGRRWADSIQEEPTY